MYALDGRRNCHSHTYKFKNGFYRLKAFSLTIQSNYRTHIFDPSFAISHFTCDYIVQVDVENQLAGTGMCTIKFACYILRVYVIIRRKKKNISRFMRLYLPNPCNLHFAWATFNSTLCRPNELCAIFCVCAKCMKQTQRLEIN